jgi:hypothetical protein
VIGCYTLVQWNMQPHAIDLDSEIDFVAAPRADEHGYKKKNQLVIVSQISEA